MSAPASPARSFILLACLLGSASSAHAQVAPPTDSYSDAGTAALVADARAARLRTDGAMRSYTATVLSRFAASMRMPLKDRTLFRQESAARVRWSRDAANVVQVLAAREQSPGGVRAPRGLSGMGVDELYDPTQDRLYFGLNFSGADAEAGTDSTESDFWIEHPLGAGAEQSYRYQAGDTLTVTLPDGTSLRIVELLVMPRRSDPHVVRATLWIDQASGSLVQAAFRLARSFDIFRDSGEIEDEDYGKIPGFLKPMEFDISLMTVEYSLWEMKYWMPRMMRLDGVARAGVMQFPASAEVAYRMEDVLVDGDGAEAAEAAAAARVAREWGDSTLFERRDVKQDGSDFVVLTPHDSTTLLTSRELPPPIWEDAPGFATADELQAMLERVTDIPGAPRDQLPFHWGWGLGEPDMVRYNRVEALSVGVRALVPLPAFDLRGTARLGIGDLMPNAELMVSRGGDRHTLSARAYHELAATGEPGSAFGLGNSLAALVLGRDEGEYYRASGAMVTVAPGTMRRSSWEVSAYAELQNDVERNTQIALPRLWRDDVFRPNIRADEATQYGLAFRARPWWGTDPRRAQYGIDLLAHTETGDFTHSGARVTLRTALPLPGNLRLGAEAGAGTSEGDVPVQRRFYVGGASTLRGYEPSTLSGTSMARGRVELARTQSFGAVTVFADWGWAGDRNDWRDGIRRADQRLAVGAGYSLLDGLIRLDLARALWAPTGWRLDLHMDALM